MIDLEKKKQLVVKILANTFDCILFALILTVSSLVIFIGIYFPTGNIMLEAWLVLDSVGLAYYERTSKGLKIMG